ncbi:Fic family protein [Carboxylicivirga sp. N1Y90]|uniref:Fic family protein n=1 Tax=Carboxylicivirga fragile TaxID=3417571 RepID=UPI003D34A687|nr:Fic family protein [Marinilabiliaceae bacterium N1Y90]
MWNKLDQLRKQYIDLNLHEVIDYEKFAMISIVYHSTKIEGCSLSESDTKVLLEKDITAKGKPLSDHLMVKDHYQAFRFVKESAQKQQKISIEFIQAIAAQVMKNTGGEANSMAGSFNTAHGDLRLAQVYVDQKYFPDYKKVESLLSQLVEASNKSLKGLSGNDCLKLAADVHYNLVNIHPFGDGNGRTSRLLMNYIQLFNKEPLIKIFTEDRAEYIDALNETEKQQDPNIFRTFIASQQIKFYVAEIEKYKKKNKDFTLLF